MAYSRNRAVSLQAATIAEVLRIAGFMPILAQLTSAQRQKLQRYLDATVVDPAVRNEASALYQKGTKYYGELVVMDPEMKRRAQKVMGDFIPVSELDDCVRLNFTQMLDASAFTPTTDDPDEAEYLEVIRKTLEARGGLVTSCAQAGEGSPGSLTLGFRSASFRSLAFARCQRRYHPNQVRTH